LLKHDARKWLERAARREERFDWIVLDPPSFATVGKAVFRIERDYTQVAALALRLLGAGGRLLAVTNHQRTNYAGFERWLQDAGKRAGRTIDGIERRSLPEDCRSLAGAPAATKSAVVTVR
jgi:23S rRNA (cytosine1962-C5)-methyltransferase